VTAAEIQKRRDDRTAADVIRVLWAIKAHLDGDTPIVAREALRKPVAS